MFHRKPTLHSIYFQITPENCIILPYIPVSFKCIKIDLNFFLMQINIFLLPFEISQATVRYFPQASNLNYDLTIRQTNFETSKM